MMNAPSKCYRCGSQPCECKDGITLYHGDALEVLPAIPADSVDLVFGSPPYCDARTYGIGADRGCIEWVEWMLEVSEAAARICVGPVLWVAAGVTRKRNYWPAPEGLEWEWWKRGGEHHLYRPCFFHRNGIPGSGGDDWARADVEYILCLKRPGALPWSDNTAMGHPPKWAPGGEMSYRLSDGTRRNQWGGCESSNAGARRKNGSRGKKWRPSHRHHTKRRADGEMEVQDYEPPVLANPGNVIVLSLTLAELIDILICYEQATSTTADQVLRELREADRTSRLPEWFYGVCLQVEATAFLQPPVRSRAQFSQDPAQGSLSSLREGIKEKGVPERVSGELSRDEEAEVLQSPLSGKSHISAERPEDGGASAQGPKTSQTKTTPKSLRELQQKRSSSNSPPGRECHKQCSQKSPSLVSVVSQAVAQEDDLQHQGLWQSARCIRVLQQALPALQEVWRSLDSMFRARETSESSSLIHCKVGGGHMGSPFAHLNEAAFPASLCEHLILSCCPEGGVVLDPFSGSGTTCAVAKKNGRRAIGVEIREEQCEIAVNRLRQGTLFGSKAK